jgi:hypothetical protein
MNDFSIARETLLRCEQCNSSTTILSSSTTSRCSTKKPVKQLVREIVRERRREADVAQHFGNSEEHWNQVDFGFTTPRTITNTARVFARAAEVALGQRPVLPRRGGNRRS